jgi:ribosomal protein S18 acetylase RimI-like enzyme
MVNQTKFCGCIRPANPEDLPSLLDLHYRVFDTDTNHILLLGKRFMTRSICWYLGDPRAFALLAVDQSSVLGYITANEGSYYSVFYRNWRHFLWAFLTNPSLLSNAYVRRRFATLVRARRQRPKAEGGQRACLAYLAIEPDHPVRGVAPALVRAALSECHRRGWRRVTTSYHVSNKPAQLLYGILGFKNCGRRNGSHLVSVCYDTSTLTDANRLPH